MAGGNETRSRKHPVLRAIWVFIKVVFFTLLGIAAGAAIYYAGFYFYWDLYNPIQQNAQDVIALRARAATLEASITGISDCQQNDLGRLSQQITDHAGRLGAMEAELSLYADGQKKTDGRVEQLAADTVGIKEEALAVVATVSAAQTENTAKTKALEGDIATIGERIAQSDERLLTSESSNQTLTTAMQQDQASLAAISLQQWAVWTRLQLNRGDVVALRGALDAFRKQVDAARAVPGMNGESLDKLIQLIDRANADSQSNPLLLADDLDAIWSEVTALSGTVGIIPAATPVG